MPLQKYKSVSGLDTRPHNVGRPPQQAVDETRGCARPILPILKGATDYFQNPRGFHPWDQFLCFADSEAGSHSFSILGAKILRIATGSVLVNP
jgi:hypothetical protein